MIAAASRLDRRGDQGRRRADRHQCQADESLFDPQAPGQARRSLHQQLRSPHHRRDAHGGSNRFSGGPVRSRPIEEVPHLRGQLVAPRGRSEVQEEAGQGCRQTQSQQDSFRPREPPISDSGEHHDRPDAERGLPPDRPRVDPNGRDQRRRRQPQGDVGDDRTHRAAHRDLGVASTGGHPGHDQLRDARAEAAHHGADNGGPNPHRGGNPADPDDELIAGNGKDPQADEQAQMSAITMDDCSAGIPQRARPPDVTPNRSDHHPEEANDDEGTERDREPSPARYEGVRTVSLHGALGWFGSNAQLPSTHQIPTPER